MAWAKTSRQSRGYGAEHERMRRIVLAEEPLCYMCLAEGRVSASTVAEHKLCKAEGGTDDRENYGGACKPCADRKTAEEAARAQGRRAPKRTVAVGLDGWPEDS